MAESVTVAVRVRPLNSKEKAAKAEDVTTISKNSIKIKDPSTSKTKQFTYDYVYGTKTAQETVFNDLGKKYLDNIWKGYNCTLFAYGQTGAGKSYSMTGDKDPETARGIIPRGCQELFSRIKDNKDANIKYEVRVSFLELYNEKLQDLLDPKTAKTIKIRESSAKGVYVENAVEEAVSSYEEIEELLDEGNKARTVAATAMNATSSRSHSILTVFFTKKTVTKNDTTETTTQTDARLNLVDLAGSERQSKTEASGQRLTEACAINKSLSALGNVITALANKAKGQKNVFIPYRDSILTRVLQDSLGGNSKTIMIAALSPASTNYDESVSTLEYANRAKSIKNKPIVNESESDKLIRELQEELASLKAQLGVDGATAPAGTQQLSEEEQKKLDEQYAKEREELEKKREETTKKQAALGQQQAEFEAQLAKLQKEKAKSQTKEETPQEKAIKDKIKELEKAADELEEEANKQSDEEIALAEKEEELEDQKEELRKAQDEYAAVQLRLQEMQETEEERKERAQKSKESRQEFLKNMGLSVGNMAEMAGIAKETPQLQNLSTSPDMNGALVYYLQNDETHIGSKKDLGGIVITGLGVAEDHAVFIVKKKEVYVKPTEGNKVLVDGVWVDSTESDGVKLEPGCRIIVGRTNMFRYISPDKEAKKMDPEEEIDLLKAYMAIAAGKCKDVKEYNEKVKTTAWLMEADNLVDEANQIADTIGKKITYGMDIDQANKEVTVVVNDLGRGIHQEWELHVLEEKLPDMRSILADYLEDGTIDVIPEKDPFINPPEDVLLGTATVIMKNLVLAGAMRQTLSIREDNGNGTKKGEVKLSFSLKTYESSSSSSSSKSKSKKEVACPLKTAPKKTYVYSEPADGENFDPEAPPPKLIKTTLKKCVDTDQIIGKKIIMHMDGVKVVIRNEVEEDTGIFLKFLFPGTQQNISDRVEGQGKSKSFVDEKTKKNAASFVFYFDSFSEEDIEMLKNLKLKVEVWGHENADTSFSAGENENDKKIKQLKRELAVARAAEQKKTSALAAKEKELEDLQGQINEIQEKLDGSSSCTIL